MTPKTRKERMTMPKFRIIDEIDGNVVSARTASEAIEKYNETANLFFAVLGFAFAAVLAGGTEWSKLVAVIVYCCSVYLVFRRDEIKFLTKNTKAIKVKP